jgi:hypothetical protein
MSIQIYNCKFFHDYAYKYYFSCKMILNMVNRAKIHYISKNLPLFKIPRNSFCSWIIEPKSKYFEFIADELHVRKNDLKK